MSPTWFYARSSFVPALGCIALFLFGLNFYTYLARHLHCPPQPVRCIEVHAHEGPPAPRLELHTLEHRLPGLEHQIQIHVERHTQQAERLARLAEQQVRLIEREAMLAERQARFDSRRLDAELQTLHVHLNRLNEIVAR